MLFGKVLKRREDLVVEDLVVPWIVFYALACVVRPKTMLLAVLRCW